MTSGLTDGGNAEDSVAVKGRLAKDGSKPITRRLDLVTMVERASCWRSGVGCARQDTSREAGVNHKQVNDTIQEVGAKTQNVNYTPEEAEVNTKKASASASPVNAKVDDMDPALPGVDGLKGVYVDDVLFSLILWLPKRDHLSPDTRVPARPPRVVWYGCGMARCWEIRRNRYEALSGSTTHTPQWRFPEEEMPRSTQDGDLEIQLKTVRRVWRCNARQGGESRSGDSLQYERWRFEDTT